MSNEVRIELSVTQAQFDFAKALAEIAVHILVLNLFVEYVHAPVIESFSVSVVTAVLLWLMLGAIVRLERRSSTGGGLPLVLSYLCAGAILFVSKFAILEVVAFVTAGWTARGHFFEVVAIVLALMAAEALLSWIH